MKDLNNLTDEELKALLEEVTPYTVTPQTKRPIILRLLEQWQGYDQSWESFPKSRREMFLDYKSVSGKFPDVTTPSVFIFNFLNSHQLGGAVNC